MSNLENHPHPEDEFDRRYDRIQELEKSLRKLVFFMNVAFDADGDTFGVYHNDATDATSEAEILLS